MLTLRWPENRLTKRQSVYNHLHNIRQIRKFLAPASTNKLPVQGVIMARIDYCLLYGVPAVHLFKLQRPQNSEARLITHIPCRYCHITAVLLALHYGYRWSSEFAIKSLWSLSRLFTIWGLCNLRSNVGVILHVPTAKFKLGLGDRSFTAAAPKILNVLRTILGYFIFYIYLLFLLPTCY